MPSLLDRFKNSWNAFMGRDPTDVYNFGDNIGQTSYYRPDRVRLRRGASKSIVSTIYNRIAVDCSDIDIKHVYVDDEGKFKSEVDSDFNQCLKLSANLDQASKAFIQDVVMSMFDEGCVAVAPVVTSGSPYNSSSYKIYELRTGKIMEWAPHHIVAEIYNEDTGLKQQLKLRKDIVAIVENPFYAIMNEPNSIAQRLIRVLSQLESLNEQSSSGKMDLIIQLPYSLKSQARIDLAENRRKILESQLTDSQYGIGYIDSTEKVIQLNRSLENNLYNQALDLTQQLYNQFGLTEKIFNGTASEQEELDYYSRTINPILSAITQEFERKFLTKTARTQGQAVRYFRDPFKLVPVKELAEISDKFTRNEIMSSNELRSVVGLVPSDDPKADELINSNLNHSDQELGRVAGSTAPQADSAGGGGVPNQSGIDTTILDQFSNLQISK